MPDKTRKELALEIQQLRQCIVSMLIYLPIPRNQVDYWWEELTAYQKVEKE